MYIIIDNERQPLYLHENPYGYGKCLCNDVPHSFTLFTTRASARYALTITRKYAKDDGVDKYWKTDTWKIIKAVEV